MSDNKGFCELRPAGHTLHRPMLLVEANNQSHFVYSKQVFPLRFAEGVNEKLLKTSLQRGVYL